MTAHQLLADLTAAGCRPEADGCELVLPTGPPPGLARPLDVLHTGVRALLVGRPWVGLVMTEDGTALDALAVVLDPRVRLPAGVRYLGVLGDLAGGWDRVPASARCMPGLFDRAPAAPPKRKAVPA